MGPTPGKKSKFESLRLRHYWMKRGCSPLGLFPVPSPISIDCHGVTTVTRHGLQLRTLVRLARHRTLILSGCRGKVGPRMNCAALPRCVALNGRAADRSMQPRWPDRGAPHGCGRPLRRRISGWSLRRSDRPCPLPASIINRSKECAALFCMNWQLTH